MRVPPSVWLSVCLSQSISVTIIAIDVKFGQIIQNNGPASKRIFVNLKEILKSGVAILNLVPRYESALLIHSKTVSCFHLLGKIPK